MSSSLSNSLVWRSGVLVQWRIVQWRIGECLFENENEN
jgi:hypothetical protein